MKSLVIIPTYNEREALPAIVQRVRTATDECDILIVDDNSPDGTGELADSFARDDAQIRVLHREGKEGLGRAYLHAFSWAMEDGGYTHLVQMDADGSHRPEELPLLLERAAMSDAPDLVIGSRYVRGGETVGWSRLRELLSRGGNAYIRLWLGLPVSDATAGFRVYKVDFLHTLDLESVESAGYFFQTDMTYLVHNADGHIVEMPISFAEREAGISKLSGNIFTESLKRTTRMGLAHRTAQLQNWLKK